MIHKREQGSEREKEMFIIERGLFGRVRGFSIRERIDQCKRCKLRCCIPQTEENL